MFYILQRNFPKNTSGSGGIRTHASEETGALNQRLRPLGHATLTVFLFPLITMNKVEAFDSCKFGLAIHQNDHQARRRFVEWAQNEIEVVPDFHKRILFSDEAHFWLNGYVNKQNCRIWSEANPQVYVEEKLTVWCALWAGGILLQKR
ncbi:putative DD41D transposase [Trichonephila clavipes]|uniref:Putative DD41D transposase n=1 Tax=Trichonephila clavipes TaxID=2585209 RepID=A0A8X6SNF2_TRICX|nr:putative DD41D transposase [Trichonephila clavipes]